MLLITLTLVLPIYLFILTNGQGDQELDLGLIRTFAVPYVTIDVDDFEDHGNNYSASIRPFANASSHFVECAILHAHPHTVCQSCLDEYTNVNDTFYQLVHNAEVLPRLTRDRVQIIISIHQQILFDWKRSRCDNCYDIDLNVQPPIFTIKNETLEIEQLYNETYYCILNNLNKSICHMDEKNVSHCRNVSCTNCSDVYRELNHKYDVLVEECGRPNICMDIVDVVNNTRQKWSKDLLCNVVELEVTALFVVIGFVCAFPIFFYIGALSRSQKHKSTIIPQKRLASSRTMSQFSVN